MAILAPLFGIFTSFILIYYLSSLNRSNFFLSLFFLCCNLIVLVYYGLHFSKNIFWEGVCFVHWLPLSYLLGPLLFFYVKTTIADNKKLKKWDWLHLIPAFLILCSTLPFTTLPFFILDFEFILISRSIHVIIYSLLTYLYFKRVTQIRFQVNGFLFYVLYKY